MRPPRPPTYLRQLRRIRDVQFVTPGWRFVSRARPFTRMLAAGDTPKMLLSSYGWLEPDDIRACLAYARRLVAHERIEPRVSDSAA